MMTSATDTVTSTGAVVTNPFAQGAGEVDPSEFLHPGLSYLAGVADWEAYVNGTGDYTFAGVTAIDPSDLNQASIAVGSLIGTETVTRTLTAKAAGDWVASTTSMPGITTTVTPSELSFDGEGDTKSFTVTYTRTTAPVKKFITGSLTWTNSGTGQTVRSPMAVQAKFAAKSVAGTGTNGRTTVAVTPGTKSTYALHHFGLAAVTPWPDALDSTGLSATRFDTASPNFDGVSSLEDSDIFLHQVTSATTYVKFSATAAAPVDPETNLDVYVLYRSKYSSDILKYAEVGQSDLASASESVAFNKPRAGYYLVVVDPYSLPAGGADFQESIARVQKTGGSGHLTTSPTSIHSTPTGTESYDARWGGLKANTSYVGLVRYGTSGNYSEVDVDSGTVTDPISVSPPVVSGSGAIGARLTASAGTWNVASGYLALDYQWLDDGNIIAGADTSTFTPEAARLGHPLSVQVTATLGGTTTVTSKPVTIRAASKTKLTIADRTISVHQHAVVTVTVASTPSGSLDGETVTVKYGTHSVTAQLVDGTATAQLPLLKKGTYSVSASYAGTPDVAPSSAAAQKVKVS
jgi:hypothetical protein